MPLSCMRSAASTCRLPDLFHEAPAVWGSSISMRTQTPPTLNSPHPHPHPLHMPHTCVRACTYRMQHTCSPWSGSSPKLTKCVFRLVHAGNLMPPGAATSLYTCTAPTRCIMHAALEALPEVLPRVGQTVHQREPATGSPTQFHAPTQRRAGRECVLHDCGAVRMCTCHGLEQRGRPRDVTANPEPSKRLPFNPPSRWDRGSHRSQFGPRAQPRSVARST